MPNYYVGSINTQVSTEKDNFNQLLNLSALGKIFGKQLIYNHVKTDRYSLTNLKPHGF